MWQDSNLYDELNRQVDGIVAGQAVQQDALGGLLDDLLQIARYLRLMLPPAEPSPFFHEALRARLLAEAKSGATAPAPAWPGANRRRLLIGAAIGSAISLAGLAAVVARLRWSARHAA